MCTRPLHQKDTLLIQDISNMAIQGNVRVLKGGSFTLKGTSTLMIVPIEAVARYHSAT